VLADAGRLAAAQSAGRAGRLLRRRGVISALPPPLAAWTRARDAPLPPRQTFRQWWRAEHGRPDHGSQNHGDPDHGDPDHGDPA
jgi:L-lactate dehydrogenase complex protein LldF